MLAAAIPAINHPDAQSMLWPTGDQAIAIDWLLSLMHWVCGFMYALVIVGIASLLWRARRRRFSHLSERSLHLLLRSWTALIVAGLIVLTLASFLVDRQLLSATHSDLSIRING